MLAASSGPQLSDGRQFALAPGHRGRRRSSVLWRARGSGSGAAASWRCCRSRRPARSPWSLATESSRRPTTRPGATVSWHARSSDWFPHGATTIRFFHEIDEGLWFYLHDHRLAPVPGSQPRYSDSYDKVGHLLGSSVPSRVPSRTHRPAHPTTRGSVLKDWLVRPGGGESYLLIRGPLYDRLAPDLDGLATPLHREGDHEAERPDPAPRAGHHSGVSVARSRSTDAAH